MGGWGGARSKLDVVNRGWYLEEKFPRLLYFLKAEFVKSMGGIGGSHYHLWICELCVVGWLMVG